MQEENSESAQGFHSPPEKERVNLEQIVYAGTSAQEFVKSVMRGQGTFSHLDGRRILLSEDYLAADMRAYRTGPQPVVLAVYPGYLPKPAEIVNGVILAPELPPGSYVPFPPVRTSRGPRVLRGDLAVMTSPLRWLAPAELATRWPRDVAFYRAWIKSVLPGNSTS